MTSTILSAQAPPQQTPIAVEAFQVLQTAMKNAGFDTSGLHRDTIRHHDGAEEEVIRYTWAIPSAFRAAKVFQAARRSR
ncbi:MULTISPECIES: hypothetical protein [unclassified Streptomyces]|uniref:hypothetical protein n=1 Tax=unclassified Streptomyces TaxID=2593676 RepID=UPI0033F1EE57